MTVGGPALRQAARNAAKQITGPKAEATLRTIAEISLQHGYDPIEGLLKIAMDPTTPKEIAIGLHQWLAPWFRAKPIDRSGDLEGEGGGRRVTLVVE